MVLPVIGLTPVESFIQVAKVALDGSAIADADVVYLISLLVAS
jgi:hypothetical protein